MTDERRKRYGEAIKSWELPERRLPLLLGGLIEKVMAVADAEQAELRAEVKRLEESLYAADEGRRTGPREAATVRRAEAAEAKVARVEAVISEWEERAEEWRQAWLEAVDDELAEECKTEQGLMAGPAIAIRAALDGDA